MLSSTSPLPAPAVSAPAAPTAPEYHVGLGRLRGFLILLVVVHHAILAYYPWVPPASSSLLEPTRLWEAFPVRDAARWTGWAFVAGFDDTFFMAALFLVSGLFVWPSLKRRGAAAFGRHRLVRLGLGFAGFALVFAPLAYYPAYLQTTAVHHGLAGYFRQWTALGQWPAGPGWFLWVLLALDLAAALLYVAAAPGLERAAIRCRRWMGSSPASFLLLVLCSAIAYVPMARHFGPLGWSSWGPFTVQTSRVLHYAVYFFAGVALGAAGLDHTLLAPRGSLQRQWPWWVAIASVSFLTSTAVTLATVLRPSANPLWALAASAAFSVSCAAITFAAAAICLRFGRGGSPLAASLCASAFGIYLLHYPIVSWTQYAAQSLVASGLTKGLLVAAFSVLATWAIVATAARRRRAFSRSN